MERAKGNHLQQPLKKEPLKMFGPKEELSQTLIKITLAQKGQI